MEHSKTNQQGEGQVIALPYGSNRSTFRYDQCRSGYRHILTSNKSPDQWGELMGDEGITTAILDRLLHRVEVVLMNGDSYRMKNRQNLF